MADGRRAPIAIYLINSAAFSLAAVLLFSSFLRRAAWWRYALALLSTFTVQILLLPAPQYGLFAVALVLTACFWEGRGQSKRTAYLALTAVFLIWAFVIAFTGLLMLAAPGWYGSDGYNYTVCVALVLLALAVRCWPNQVRRLQNLERPGLAILLELLVLAFYTFVMPLFFAELDDPRLYAVICLALSALIGIVGAMLGRIIAVEQETRSNRRLAEQRAAHIEQTRRLHDDAMAITHKFSKLVEGLSPLVRDGDLPGIRSYFERYIAPVYRTQTTVDSQLKHVHSDLLRGLLDAMLGQASALEAVTAELVVLGTVDVPDDLDMDLFEILGNLLSNAVQALAAQGGGELVIELEGRCDAIQCRVSNTVPREVDIAAMLSPAPRKGGERHGYGLRRVRELVDRRDEIGWSVSHQRVGGALLLTHMVTIELEGR